MRTLYNSLTYISVFVLKIVSFFNKKIKLGIDGRSQTFQKLKNCIRPEDHVFWFHCASLGEYEQGLPVFEQLKKEYPNYKIVISFFSPSGYEIKKESPVADVVVYLPFDTRRNCNQFLNSVNPELVLFVKYEIWPNYLKELHKRKIKTLLISALLRENQVYFKWYGKLMRQALFSFDHIFTQDNASKKLLEQINYKNATITGDTRFDRVSNQLSSDNTIDIISEFKTDKICLVAGSTWPEDENLLINYINSELTYSNKIIIAPHTIKPTAILKLKAQINKPTILYSNSKNEEVSKAQVLILDTIGILSKVYSYADIAYIGGAIGNTGLHNTLEAAVFGIPIVIGNQYQKFPEAKSMINNKGMFTVESQLEFNSILNKLFSDKDFRLDSGLQNSNYVKLNKGAVVQILDYIRT